MWRAVTKLVKLRTTHGGHADELRVWVRHLLRNAEELRKSSLYPGRSLNLELAITVPAEWSLPGDDWVGNVLLIRARNKDATIRERGTAAMGLWQRAIHEERPDQEKTEADLRQLIDEFGIRTPARTPQRGSAGWPRP